MDQDDHQTQSPDQRRQTALRDAPDWAALNWIGRGKVQALLKDGSMHLRVDALTSQTRKFKELVGDFFRTEFRKARPKYGPYEVVIEIERTANSPVHDVDNVAKAILDALTGVVFHDDSQVERLHVEKVLGERARVKVRARPIDPLVLSETEGAA